MKKVILLVFLVLFVLFSMVSGDGKGEWIKDIPQWMEKTVVPGLSMTVLENGKIGETHCFGVKKNGTQDKVTPHTIFEACSLSKPVFAYAVLKLVDQGKLDLDKPLFDYIDQAYIEKEYLRGTLSGIGEDFKTITARHVLSHRPGLPNWRRKKAISLLFKPGEKFSYSGEGFVYLQKVVEKITGLPLQDFMKQYVFDPLGMTHSGYIWRTDFDTLTAYPHDFMGSAKKKRKGKRAVSAASLQTTAPDFARFTQALLKGEGLKPATREQLFSKQTTVEENTVSWGLGIGIEHASNGDRLWHWGDNSNFKAFVMADLKTGNGVVFFANGFAGLALAPSIIPPVIAGSHPVFKSPLLEGYQSVDSPMFSFLESFRKKGVSQAIKEFQLKGSQKLPENVLNTLGYFLMGNKRMNDAIEIFKFNVQSYPKSANVYDSLGEAYMKSGQKQLAIENYKKSLELNPDNPNAVKYIKEMEKQE